jgi:hypothetical protein
MAISFSQLPDDMLSQVMRHLPGHHVAQMRTVNTDCNRIGKNVHKDYQDAMSGKTNEYVNTRLFDRKLDSPTEIEYWSRVFASVHTNDALKQAIETELLRLKTNEQQSSRRQMTTEQERIVNITPRRGTVAVVQAYAGTGKTTTLFEYAKKWRNVKILYLAYNKVLADESQEKFKDLPHVTVTTIHALAKKKYEEVLGRPIDIDNVSLKELMHNLPAEAARRLLSDFVRYCASDTTQEPESPDVSKLFKEKTPHDGYLKKFQLLRPQLSEFDVIMLDEVQDCTDCILDIVLSQTGHAACLFVGDVYQKIYGFRHVNSPFRYILERARNARLYYLSVSFRFGFDLMRFTNMFLRKKYNEQRGFSKTLVGNTKLCVGSDFFHGLVVVCRYNISVYKLLFEIAARGMNVHVVGKKIDFQKEITFAKDLLFLQAGNLDEITSPKVTRFESLQSLQDFHNATQNTKWKNRLQLLATHGEGLVDLWETAERQNHITHDSVRLITAHQSKGSEYDHVMVYDDFVGSSEDAHNTLYVAMTRAKKSVCISQSLLRFFEKHTPKIRYPFDTKSTNRPSTCVQCRKRTTNQLVCTEDDPMSLVQGEACTVFVYTPCCKECNV